jgi:arylsulfatase
MIEYIDGNRGDGKPFFAYLAYTAPHWPLQAPRESIAKFRGWYDDGYEALYQRRFARTRELGLIPADYTPVPPVAGQPIWEALSEDERRIEARKMEIYAAMVNDLDTYVGQVIDYLKATGQYDNTVIVFMSDNGPEALRRDTSAPLKDWVATCCDNSLDNLGAGNSYVMYGPNWARAGSVPFRRAKATTFEGGMHVPVFVHYPKAVAGGQRSGALGTVMDLVPTFLEIAGTSHPGTSYRGQPVLPVAGKSLWPIFTGKVTSVHDAGEAIGWELYGHRAVRQGDWKIVWDPTERDDARWHLFNVVADRSEQHDRSAQEPARLQSMIRLWEEYHRANGLVP